MDKVNMTEKFKLFQEHWSPKIVGEVNDCYLKLVKFKGEFVWHHHDVEDEMFMVIKGRFVMKLKEKDIQLEEGEFIVIPRGESTGSLCHKKAQSHKLISLLLYPLRCRRELRTTTDRSFQFLSTTTALRALPHRTVLASNRLRLRDRRDKSDPETTRRSCR